MLFNTKGNVVRNWSKDIKGSSNNQEEADDNKVYLKLDKHIGVCYNIQSRDLEIYFKIEHIHVS